MKKKRDKIRDIISQWFYLKVIPYGTSEYYSSTTVCAFEVYGRNIYIYSNRPGILIGVGGNTYEELKSALKAAGIKKKVWFVDLGASGYVRTLDIKRRWF